MRSPIALIVSILLLASCGSRVVTPTPSPVPTVPGTATPTGRPTGAPSLISLDHDVVYFARDRLPPVASHVDRAGAGDTPEARVLARLFALFAADAPAALFNATSSTRARPSSIRIDGDVAIADFVVSGGDWNVNGSTAVRAFIQQIVYTATEEPGIRRALILENGRQAIIGGEGVVIDHPASREDMLGYTFAAPRDIVAVGSEPRSVPLVVSASVALERGIAATARLVITANAPGAEAKVPLAFSAAVRPNDELATPTLGKWILSVDVPFAATEAQGTLMLDGTPLRAIRTTVADKGVCYDLGLDDLRPWRVFTAFDPLRLVVDIGGDPQAVSPNIALYTPPFGVTVHEGYAIAGLIRAFEAQFEYRIRDAFGRLLYQDFAQADRGTNELWGTFALSFPKVPPGAASVEILLRSPRDGEIHETVSIPVEVR